MPVIQRDAIQITAEGLIRNFGFRAAEEARRLAEHYAMRVDQVSQELWMAVAEKVEDIQQKSTDLPVRSRNSFFLSGKRGSR